PGSAADQSPNAGPSRAFAGAWRRTGGWLHSGTGALTRVFSHKLSIGIPRNFQEHPAVRAKGSLSGRLEAARRTLAAVCLALRETSNSRRWRFRFRDVGVNNGVARLDD